MSQRRALAEQMGEAADALLASLDNAQRSAMTWPFPTNEERELWFYTPTNHGGLPLTQMTSAQHRRTHQLLATGLSRAGYVTATTVMNLENILDQSEGWTAGFGRDRGRDPLLYWIAIFGEPGSDAWGWRFGGHHISLSFTLLNGEVVGTTPCFFGADPATAPLLGPHLHRPLAAAEDLARHLIHSLRPSVQAEALLAPIAPTDLVGANRSTLVDGDRTLPLELIWRGRLEAELDQAMARVHRNAESDLGVTDEIHRTLAFSATPKGASVDGFNAEEQELLRALLDAYLDRVSPALADGEKAKFSGSTIASLSFVWAGGIEVGEPHYYRIQGADLFIEYDNTQRSTNHIHSVWRDLSNDFGRDALAEHYLGHDHGHKHQ